MEDVVARSPTIRQRIRALPLSVKVLAAVLLLSPLLVLPYLRGDGNGYYAWVR